MTTEAERDGEGGGCLHPTVIQVRNGAGQSVAVQCSICLHVTSALCPVCEQWFPDAQHHQSRGNLGVCGYFMKRGRLHVPHEERTALYEKFKAAKTAPIEPLKKASAG